MHYRYLALALPTLGICQTTTLDLPFPTPTDGNVKGSSQCGLLGTWQCPFATEKYEDDVVYYKETRRVQSYQGLFNAKIGCTANFQCNDEEAYKSGTSGKALKAR